MAVATILVVDPQPPAVVAAVERQARIVIASTLAEARTCYQRLRAELRALIFDTELADGCSFDLLRQVRARGDVLPALLLSTHRDRLTITRAFRLGASHLPRPAARVDLEAFLERAGAIEPTAAEALDPVGRGAAVCGIDGRQLQILRLVASGFRTCDLAPQLGVSDNTVKSHVRQLLRKSGARSVQDAVVTVLGLGMTQGAATATRQLWAAGPVGGDHERTAPDPLDRTADNCLAGPTGDLRRRASPAGADRQPGLRRAGVGDRGAGD